MNIHICLVSQQLLANYIPVLMQKPDAVCLISSASMEATGLTARFKAMLDALEIPNCTYDDMPSTNMESIYDYALEISEKIKQQYSNANLTLNITGGTKLMSQGFTEVMSNDAQLIYTDTQHNRLEYIGEKTRKSSIPLPSVLKIKDYLKAYGANYKQSLSDDSQWQQEILQRKAVTKYLGQQAEALDGLIGSINYLVNQAISDNSKVLEKPTQYLNTTPRGEWKTALQKMQQSGLLSWDGQTEIRFSDIESARYLGGVWLEEYVYHLAKDEQPEDVRSGVKVSWDSSKKTHNELDVVLVHNNRMLIIECKTMRFGGGYQQKDSDVLYKIDSLGDDLKGLYGGLWLVSARTPTDNMIDRAKDRRIKIINPSDLKKLRSHFQQWMQ